MNKNATFLVWSLFVFVDTMLLLINPSYTPIRYIFLALMLFYPVAAIMYFIGTGILYSFQSKIEYDSASRYVAGSVFFASIAMVCLFGNAVRIIAQFQ